MENCNTKQGESLREVNDYDKEAKFFDATTLDRKRLYSQDLKNLIIGMSDDEMREQIILVCRDRAKELKLATDWDRWFKQFSKDLARAKIRTISNMEDAAVQGYNFGDYSIDNSGLHYFDSNMNCYRDFCKGTPLVVSRIFENIDREPQKVELAFKLRSRWQTVCCELRNVSDSRQALALSDSGISVNTLNSALVVGYITDFISMNQNNIPVVSSVGRLGWFGAEFIPYDNKYAYDGYGGNKERYEAVACEGSLDIWVNECNLNRANPVVRMLIDASLGSPLLSKLNAQMFLVHLWGTTEAGKTVAMQFAMSVWGDAEKLIQTFNATAVGLERTALFYKHLPLALDELQTVKDKYNNTDKTIYQLCSGVSKVRGNKFGGNEEQMYWRNVIISTGEQPLTDDNSGGGAKNRAIELHCDCKLFTDFQRTIEVYRSNYGVAGKEFLDKFVKPSLKDETLMKAYKYFCGELVKCNFTDKQRNSIAVMCLADYGYNILFLHQEKTMALKNALDFYRSHADMFTDKEDIKIGQRSYDDFISWVQQNSFKFSSKADVEQYGVKGEGFVSVLPTALDKWCFEGGYNKRAVLSEWKGKNLIDGDEKTKFRKKCKIGAEWTNCYKIFLTGVNMKITDFVPTDEELPF